MGVGERWEYGEKRDTREREMRERGRERTLQKSFKRVISC
jgi:hypothetical protein